MREVKIGLVGIGEIGEVHARAYAGVPHARLCLAAGTRPEKAKELAAKLGGAPVYESYEALLADPGVEGVDICVPNHLHREFVVRALRAGKHVLCEKPIALTCEDADAMLQEAERAGRFLVVGHVLRFWPECVKTREAIAAGAIGQPLLISGRRLVALLEGTTGAEGWRHDPELSGGAVIDLQIHDLDLYCWLFGTPTAVVARGARSEDGAISHVFTVMDHPGGVTGFVEASFMMKGKMLDIGFRVLGTKGSIEYRFSPSAPMLHGLGTQAAAQAEPSLTLTETGGIPQALYTPEEDSFPLAMQRQVAHFAECVSAKRAPATATGEESRRALALCIAARRSCETGEVVRNPC
ncbi:MAG: Gfo/Idh/MocA family oxidoreductase [Armatimonadetes bacterium]|nr:Gfo/Idh/MocA family oxidoreductase [Armatimonadota bacterium]